MVSSTVIVKIGTSSLTNSQGKLDERRLRHHVNSLNRLHHRGYRVVLVSSGAIAAGFHELGLSERPRTLEGKQAAAALGQGVLVQHYREAFALEGKTCAQVLLTRSDFDHRKRYLNALRTLNFLLDREVVPIINENDSVAVEEIRWGDNDTLASLVAGLLQAQWLLLITNTEGVYTDNPLRNPHATQIQYLDQVDDSLIQRLDDSKSDLGSGGMRSKLAAAKQAAEAGVKVYIGTEHSSVGWMEEVVEGNGRGTYIDCKTKQVSRKEQWITHSTSQGQLWIDSGAENALLLKGSSLLPCGVVEVKGCFQPGELVEVTDMQGTIIGRGVSRYSALLLNQVKGWQSQKVQSFYPSTPEEVIHRDDWVGVSIKHKE